MYETTFHVPFALGKQELLDRSSHAYATYEKVIERRPRGIDQVQIRQQLQTNARAP